MTLKVFAGISLRNDAGVHFGTLVRIRTGLAGVRTDAVYAVGDIVEFQLELTGFDTTVHGLAQVQRAEISSEELSSYLLRIRRMRRADQELLQEWYDQQQAGLEPSLRGDDAPRALDSQVESQLASGVGAYMPAPTSPAGGRGRDAIRALLQDASSRSAAEEPSPGAAAPPDGAPAPGGESPEQAGATTTRR